MSYKTISVYLPDPGCVRSVMATAIPLAQKFSSRLIGLHAMQGIPVRGTIGAQLPGEIISQYRDFMAADARDIEQKWESSLDGTGIDSAWHGASNVTIDTGVTLTINRLARCSDLVLLGQGDSDHASDLTADVILGSGRPVLVIPRDGQFAELDQKAVVAWDGSREAARALFDALPLLSAAKTVHIVTIGKGDKARDAVEVGDVDISETLSSHGITSEIIMIAKDSRSAGETLLEQVDSSGSQVLVMGCYSHSRLRERIFGGATRHVLNNMKTPVLMSH